MKTQSILTSWLGTAVIVHLASGREFPGLLSAIEGHPEAFQVEVTQGQQLITTVFLSSDVVALTLPNGQTGKKRKK